MQKITKRILAYTLTLAIILSTIVFGAASTVSAETVAADFTAWDGSRDTNLEGSGTEKDPYLVKTAAQLAAVVSSNNGGAWKGKYFKLANDIKINDTSKANWMDSVTNSWVWYDFRFTGTFDGDGHTIDGLYYNGSKKRVGLFAYVGAKDGYACVIKNFKMTNTYIKNDVNEYGTGFVAGQASDVTSFHNIYIDDTCEIVSTTVDGIGGIVGRTEYNLVMSNIAMNGKLSGKANIGSFVGLYASNGKLNIKSSYSTADCYVTGTIRNLADASKNVYVVKKQGTMDAVADVITAEAIKGEGAKTAMPNLNFKTLFKTVEGGYPVPTTVQVWDNTVASGYSNFAGSGTQADPYIINNGAQLAFAVSKNANLADGSYFKLAKDIVLNDTSYEGWEAGATPWIWNNHARFNGTLDGDGHTIEGLYINTDSTKGRMGLFAYIGKTSAMDKVAEVKNLTFTGASVTSTATSKVEGVSIIAGQTSGHTHFENVYVDETCELTVTDKAVGVGTFVGRGYDGEGGVASAVITNCAALATLNAGSASTVGAITGSYWTSASSVTINNSFTNINKPLSGNKPLSNSANNVGLVSYEYGTTVVDVEKMKGLGANLYMTGLNFNQVWKTVENGYPVLTDEAYRANYWDGTAATEFASGTGTEADPYIIKTASELYLLATLGTEETAGKYFALGNDIVVSNVRAGWENESPYAWAVKAIDFEAAEYDNTFAGTLDGAGYTVSGLYFADFYFKHNNEAFGLLPVVSANAVIKNLKLNNVASTVASSEYVGAVAGGAFLTEAEAANPLNKAQFVGVNLENSTIAMLGRGVPATKFDLCKADSFVYVNGEHAAIRNCNTDLAYTSDVVIYNANNIDANTTHNVRAYILGYAETYITDMNGDRDFDIRDLVAANIGYLASVQ